MVLLARDNIAVALTVACCVVSGEGRKVRDLETSMVAVDCSHHARPGRFENQVSDGGTIELLAILVDDRRLNAEEWECC